MFYHTDCGHVIEVSEGSMMVSEGGWKDYTSQYLGNCPVCEDKYPYLKYLDDSVRDELQELVYKLWSLDVVSIYIPTFQSPVDTVRISNTQAERLEKRLGNNVVDSISQEDEEIVLNI